MTTILPEECTCPECGKRVIAYLLHSHNTCGAEKPFFVYRGYARCPRCGHHIEEAGAIEFLSDDPDERALQLDPRFEPTPERERTPEGETEVVFGKWIPGARPPKPEE